jgi:uncharacterized membrane protein
MIVSSLLLVLIDSIYLFNIGKPVFGKTVKSIQGSEMVLNVQAAVFTYVLMAILINYFIISQKKSVLDAFILGFCVYGIFDFTNLAIFKNYTLKAAIIDTLWGGILFAVVTSLTYKLKN